MAKRGLGKGISSLIGDYTFDSVVETAVVTDEQAGQERVIRVRLEDIESNPGQPRTYFDIDALEELAASIKEQGIIQPIIVQEQHDPMARRYVIIAGERRFRAAGMAGLQEISCIVKNFSDERRLEIALIENIQRENLNPIEEAKAFRYLIDRTSLSQEELSKKLGKKRSTIANSLRLLNLPIEMQKSVTSGSLSAGHARAILSVINPSEQIILFKKITDQGLSVRQAEQAAAALNEGSRATLAKKRQEKVRRIDPDLRIVEERLLEAYGTRVTIKGTMDHGKIEISYYSMDDLRRIYNIVTPDADLFEVDK